MLRQRDLSGLLAVRDVQDRPARFLLERDDETRRPGRFPLYFRRYRGEIPRNRTTRPTPDHVQHRPHKEEPPAPPKSSASPYRITHRVKHNLHSTLGAPTTPTTLFFLTNFAKARRVALIGLDRTNIIWYLFCYERLHPNTQQRKVITMPCSSGTFRGEGGWLRGRYSFSRDSWIKSPRGVFGYRHPQTCLSDGTLRDFILTLIRRLRWWSFGAFGSRGRQEGAQYQAGRRAPPLLCQ